MSHSDLSTSDPFMEMALRLARKAFSREEVPVGAVVVVEGKVVGRGYNQSLARSDPTAHAEILALRAASKAVRGLVAPTRVRIPPSPPEIVYL